MLIPVYNEQANVTPLHAELTAVLAGMPLDYELIFVDDGSTDGTAARLLEVRIPDPQHVRIASLRRNYGQTAALSAAFDLARGKVLVPIDGDRQNDPADIPPLLQRLDQGFDVVSNWRRLSPGYVYDEEGPVVDRQSPDRGSRVWSCMTSVAPSRPTAARSSKSGYKAKCTASSRSSPPWQGTRVTKLVVSHRPRTAGRTKYGLGRTLNVVLDLLLIRFFFRYSQRPMHLFGRIGIYSMLLSFLSFAGMLYYRSFARS